MSRRTFEWNGYQSALNGAIGTTEASIELHSVVGLRAPGRLVIDPDVQERREWVEFTGISGNILTGVLRGLQGNSNAGGAAAHPNGAIIRSVPMHQVTDDIFADIEDLEDGIGSVGSSLGAHVGAGGGAHALATPSAHGFLDSAHVTKLTKLVVADGTFTPTWTNIVTIVSQGQYSYVGTADRGQLTVQYYCEFPVNTQTGAIVVSLPVGFNALRTANDGFQGDLAKVVPCGQLFGEIDDVVGEVRPFDLAYDTAVRLRVITPRPEPGGSTPLVTEPSVKEFNIASQRPPGFFNTLSPLPPPLPPRRLRGTATLMARPA